MLGGQHSIGLFKIVQQTVEELERPLVDSLDLWGVWKHVWVDLYRCLISHDEDRGERREGEGEGEGEEHKAN